ncbi:MAG: SIMPL domain-containing protein [Methanothrix sp.]|nr:SIMPL domain-containing protein [Methanothrix sp.]
MKKVNTMLLAFLLLLAASFSVSASEENVSKLIVQGEGKVSAVPDMATVVLGVEARNASALVAAKENARLMNETISALLSSGIASADIQTSHFSLTSLPQEETKASGEMQKAPEFIATSQVTVRLNNTADVGRVLDAAAAAGSNSIKDLNFDIRNPQPEKDRALTLAIADARRKAEVAAEAAGVELGRVLEIAEGYGYVTPAAKSAIQFDVATPVQPGEMEVTASVTLTYEVS